MKYEMKVNVKLPGQKTLTRVWISRIGLIIAFCIICLHFVSLIGHELLGYYTIAAKFDNKKVDKDVSSKESIFNTFEFSDTCITISITLKKVNAQQATVNCLIDVDVPKNVLVNLFNVLTNSQVIVISDSTSQQLILMPSEINKSINIHFLKIYDDHSTMIAIPMQKICECYNPLSNSSRITVEQKFPVISHTGSFPWDITIFAKKVWVIAPPLFYFNESKRRLMGTLPIRLVINGEDLPGKTTSAYLDFFQDENIEFQALFLRVQSDNSTKYFISAILVSLFILTIFVGYLTFQKNRLQQAEDLDSFLLGLAGFAFALVTLRNGFIPVGMLYFTIPDYLFGFMFSLALLYIKIVSLEYIYFHK